MFQPIDDGARDTWTRYHGAKVSVAVFLLGPHRVALGLSDTRRCAADHGACKRLLGNLGEQYGVAGAAGYATQLNVLCRKITRWVDQPKRDVSRVVRRRAYI